MLRALTTGAAAVAMTASMVAFAGPAEAARDYANCDALHRDFRYGVARSDAAADRQVRTGHYRPAVRPKVYRLNSESDADNDGTACEVSR